MAYEEAMYLVGRRHEVWAVTQDSTCRYPEYCVDGRIHLLTYQTPDMPLWNPVRAWAHQKRAERLLRKHLPGGVDIVHAHALHRYVAASKCFREKARFCYSVHSPVRLELEASSRGASGRVRLYLRLAARANHHLEHQCLAKADCITAFFEHTQTLLGQLHGEAIAGKTRAIPGLIDAERFQIEADRPKARALLGWPVDEPIFFTFRRLVPRAVLDRLTQAASCVRAAGLKFRLIVGGSGPLLQGLQQLTSALKLEECIRFLGFAPEEELPSLHAAADAFILPTAELECFGLIALESLACGRPVLATPVCAIPDLVRRFEKERSLPTNREARLHLFRSWSRLRGEDRHFSCGDVAGPSVDFACLSDKRESRVLS